MRLLLLLIIRLYWLIPVSRRKRCLFKESCSRYVFTITKERGLIPGLKALFRRSRQCRPGYILFKTEDGQEWVLLKDKSVLPKNNTTL